MNSLLDFHFCGTRTQAVLALTRHYPSYSLKRSLLKGVNALNQLGPRRVPRSLSRIGRAQEALPGLAPNGTRAFLLHKIHQTGRVYIFDEPPDAASGFVTKVALNEGAAAGIRREAAVLQSLAGRTPFHIPEVLSFDDWDGGCALRVSAIPRAWTIHEKGRPIPQALFDAVAGLRSESLPRALPASEIWGWASALAYATTPAIRAAASDIDSQTLFAVAAAHRDLGSENVFSCLPARNASDFSIIDWEFFSETAPALVDKVGVWLGVHHRTLKRMRKANVETLATKFLSDFAGMPGGCHAAVIALLHLAETGIDLARILSGDVRGSG